LTHQSCYGGDILNKTPSNKWYCERCEHLLTHPEIPDQDIKCSFCPNLKGVLKKTGSKTMPWAHVSCVNWIPEYGYTSKKKEYRRFFMG